MLLERELPEEILLWQGREFWKRVKFSKTNSVMISIYTCIPVFHSRLSGRMISLKPDWMKYASTFSIWNLKNIPKLWQPVSNLEC